MLIIYILLVLLALYCMYYILTLTGFMGHSKIHVGKQPPSLSNIGANCYLNSALQGLSSCDKFVEDIDNLALEMGNDLEKLQILNELIQILHGSFELKKINITECSIFRNWNQLGQQDSYELMAHILNEVYNDIRNFKKIDDFDQWLKIKLPMRLLISYKFQCDCGRNDITPLQSDFVLHLPISDTVEFNNLQEILDEFFDKECVMDYICQNKNCEKEYSYKSAKLQLPLPRTLCIHIHRIQCLKNRMVKISSSVKFTKKLTIKAQFVDINEDGDAKIQKLVTEVVDSIVKDTLKALSLEEKNKTDETLSGAIELEENDDEEEEEEAVVEAVRIRKRFVSEDNEVGDNFETMVKSSEKVNETEFSNSIQSPIGTISNETKDNTGIFCEYQLKAVIVHYGSAKRGHYVCYRQCDNQWFLTNDSKVKPVDERNVFYEEPYILFYEMIET